MAILRNFGNLMLISLRAVSNLLGVNFGVRLKVHPKQEYYENENSSPKNKVCYINSNIYEMEQNFNCAPFFTINKNQYN